MNILHTIRIVIVLAASAVAWNSATGSANIRDGKQVSVETTQASDLRTVLEHLCERTGMQCEISADAASITVPSIRISGVLPEVISKLLEGTNLNYIVVGATADSSARLIVTAQNAAPETNPSNSTLSVDSVTSQGASAADLQPSGGSRRGESESQAGVSLASSSDRASLEIATPVVVGPTADTAFSATATPSTEQISQDAIRRMYAPPKHRMGTVVLPTDEVGNPNQNTSQPSDSEGPH